MKSDNKALWRLILTISVVELEWLKRWAQKNSFEGNQVYLELLDFIWNMKTYSEEKLKKKFPDVDLSQRKYYLFKFLIEGLTVLKKEGNTLAGFKGRAETCFERGAWGKALNFIEKALEKALEIEEFEAAINILKMNDKVLPYVFMGKSLMEKLNENVVEIRSVLELKKELEEIEVLEATDFSLIRNGLKAGVVEEKDITEYAQNFTKKREFRTKKGQFLWYLLQVPIYYFHRNWTELEKITTGMFSILKDNKWLQKKYPEEYFSSLMKAIVTEVQAGKNEKAMQLYKGFERVKFDSPLSFKFLQYQLLTLFVMAEEGITGMEKKALKLIGENDERIEDYFDTHWLHLIRLSQAESLFSEGEFEKGTKVVSWLLNRHKVRPEVEIQAKMLHLIGMMETKDFHGIDLLGGKYSRSSAKLPYLPISKAIIDFIRKSPKYRSNWKVEREVKKVLDLCEKHREEASFHSFYKKLFSIENWFRGFLKEP